MSSNIDDWLDQQLQPQPAPAAPTAPARTAKPTPLGWLPVFTTVLLAGLLVWILLGSGGQPGPGPGPGPTVNVVDAVEASEKRGAENRAKVMDRLADMVAGGKIANRKQLQEASRELTEAARINAWKPIDELDHSTLPDPSFEGEEAAVSKYLRSKAEGHRRAAQ